MIGKIIQKAFRLIVYGYKGTSKTYIEGLKKRGAQIGEDVTIYDSINTVIDDTQAWLLKIGNHVKITSGVIILTHDYSWSVLKNSPHKLSRGSILGANSPVTIGDNVFIGMNAIILRGCTIGNNVVIGAGSVVSSNLESDAVYAGNPAKKIMSITEYYNKRKNKQKEEAVELAKNYYSRFKKVPTKEVFHEYFMLFCDPDEAERNPVFNEKMKLGNGIPDSIEYMKDNKQQFESFEEFIAACGIEGLYKE